MLLINKRYKVFLLKEKTIVPLAIIESYTFFKGYKGTISKGIS